MAPQELEKSASQYATGAIKYDAQGARGMAITNYQKAIESLMKDRTALVIAHRLSTVQNADKIIVIDNGNVIEVGSHHDLYEKDGLYRRLYDIQFD